MKPGNPNLSANKTGIDFSVFMSENRVIKYIQQIRKEWKLSVILIVAISGMYGWLSGNMIFASYSEDYIPIAPANISIVLILFGVFLFNSGIHPAGKSSSLNNLVVSIILLYCLLIFIQFFFRLTWDIESVFIKEPANYGRVLIGRMSPLTSVLYILICFGYLFSKRQHLKGRYYFGAIVSLIAFILSSVLFLGYLLNAPLLYGGEIIPVSLPSTICFLLFSLILLRLYQPGLSNFNFFGINKMAGMLLKSFLPAVVFVITLEGLLITRLKVTGQYFTLAVALILILTVILSVILIYKVSYSTGDKLHKAETDLKESHNKFRLIADYNYDWEFWISEYNLFKYNSPSCEHVSGYKPSDFDKNPDLILDIIHPQDRCIYEEHLKLEHNGKPCPGIDFRIITKSGEVKWINHVCQPVYNPDGNLAGTRGSNCDITARKVAEDQISRLNEELKETNADKDRFLSILGHDLKSPFNTILGMSELLVNESRKLNKEKIELFAGQLNQTAGNTYDLLNDILMWANSKQGKIPFRPQHTDLYEICEKTISNLSPMANSKNINIDYSGLNDKSVYADPDMLKTIFRNLISNAIKFSFKNSNITISTEPNGRKVKISVIDHGVGISKENLSKLFSITQVLSTPGTCNESGTGLGLLLCKDFIEKNGGEIRVESEVGKGCKVSFELQQSESEYPQPPRHGNNP